jgi:hypothetical protein
MKMASTKAIELTESPDGLPRRRAIQGLAGSLAGIAALGAVNASGKKKKKKKSSKGTLVRFQTQEQTGSVPTSTALAPSTTVTANCPAAGSNEEVFATGGGYETTAAIPVTTTVATSQVTNNGRGWEVTFQNTLAAAANVTVSVVCAYFKT